MFKARQKIGSRDIYRMRLGGVSDATFEYEYHFVEYEYEYDQEHPFLDVIIPEEPYFTLLFDLLV